MYLLYRILLSYGGMICYMKSVSNNAYIDGQNLYMNTKEFGWSVDLSRFRVYLREKYHVETAYYFLTRIYRKLGLYSCFENTAKV